jgi:hypothetical protein
MIGSLHCRFKELLFGSSEAARAQWQVNELLEW